MLVFKPSFLHVKLKAKNFNHIVMVLNEWKNNIQLLINEYKMYVFSQY